MEKKLYPFKFIPIQSLKPWGGSALVKDLKKKFVEVDENGDERILGPETAIGESWEIADMGIEDSVVADGWLAGNTISELMDTYLERIVGEDVYKYFGRQFPILVKFLDIQGKLSLQVHPDDEMAAERYDSLGKPELWYVLDAKPGSKMYLGFNKEMTAQEFYDRCNNGTVEEVLNVVYPKKGDSIYVAPGTVHSADGGLLLVEIQESSDMVFRLHDWGRENNPATARPMHLEEAIDMVDYRPFDQSLYKKGPLWGESCSCEPSAVDTLHESAQFNVTKLNLKDPLHIYTEKFESFIIYVCAEGAASVQIPSTKENGEAFMDNYEFTAGETLLVPADMPDFYLVPRDPSTVILEVVSRPTEEPDDYIDPDTEAFLENEDYEGLEDGAFDDDDEMAHSNRGASPLNFFS